jgi:hypothetical protein
MAFVTDKAELKPGLVLFRRGDVDHRMWYCRMKIPKADRYKTVSLKTTDIEVARERLLTEVTEREDALKEIAMSIDHSWLPTEAEDDAALEDLRNQIIRNYPNPNRIPATHQAGDRKE